MEIKNTLSLLVNVNYYWGNSSCQKVLQMFNQIDDSQHLPVINYVINCLSFIFVLCKISRLATLPIPLEGAERQ